MDISSQLSAFVIIHHDLIDRGSWGKEKDVEIGEESCQE